MNSDNIKLFDVSELAFDEANPRLAEFDTGGGEPEIIKIDTGGGEPARCCGR